MNYNLTHDTGFKGLLLNVLLCGRTQIFHSDLNEESDISFSAAWWTPGNGCAEKKTNKQTMHNLEEEKAGQGSARRRINDLGNHHHLHNLSIPIWH